jgi:hypothetical protein
MRCLQKSTDPMRDRPPILLREGGVPYRPTHATDPLAEWMELMEAVEALCPKWPVREEVSLPGGFLL